MVWESVSSVFKPGMKLEVSNKSPHKKSYRYRIQYLTIFSKTFGGRPSSMRSIQAPKKTNVKPVTFWGEGPQAFLDPYPSTILNSNLIWIKTGSRSKTSTLLTTARKNLATGVHAYEISKMIILLNTVPEAGRYLQMSWFLVESWWVPALEKLLLRRQKSFSFPNTNTVLP